MAGLGKAARGKRRWIGVRISSRATSREACEEIFTSLLEGLHCKLYDHYIGPDCSVEVIVQVPLNACEAATSRINSDEGC